MSLIEPEIEFVDRATESIRYLEHGWPTELCRWHAHEEYELHLIVATRGKAFVGDYIGEFEPGTLYLTGPNLPHNWVTQDFSAPQITVRDKLVQFNDENLRWLVGAFSEFSALNPLLGESRSGIEFVEFDPTVAEARLESMRDSSGPERVLALLRFLLELNSHKNRKLLSVVTFVNNNKNDKLARIGTVVDYVVDHYSERLSVEHAASKAGMSPSAFSRHFRAKTGNKFTEFVNRVRIGQACNMLYSTEDQVSRICFEVGFQNLSNFNRQFLKMKGITPTAYRETARRELVANGNGGGRLQA